MEVLRKVIIFNENLNIEQEYEVPEAVADYLEGIEDECVLLDLENTKMAEALEFAHSIVLN